MKKENKIFVAGHSGLIGSAIVRALEREGYSNLVLRSCSELDLTNQSATHLFFNQERPDYVFLGASRMGGILANNSYRAEFIYNNLIVQTNVIDIAWRFGVKRLLFFGSSCIYPRDCAQPMQEGQLLAGPLEPSSEPYAIAKIAGLKMCEAYNSQYGTNFVSVVPNNIYGPNDDFDLETAHVLPALIRKAHEAKVSGNKSLVLWGTGTPKREFLHADDMASACIFIMNNEGFKNMANIGSGEEVSIRQLTELICEVVGFQGNLVFDSSKPDGAPRKLLDISLLKKMGWESKVELKEGLINTYRWYREAYGKNSD